MAWPCELDHRHRSPSAWTPASTKGPPYSGGCGRQTKRTSTTQWWVGWAGGKRVGEGWARVVGWIVWLNRPGEVGDIINPVAVYVLVGRSLERLGHQAVQLSRVCRIPCVGGKRCVYTTSYIMLYPLMDRRWAVSDCRQHAMKQQWLRMMLRRRTRSSARSSRPARAMSCGCASR